MTVLCVLHVLVVQQRKHAISHQGGSADSFFFPPRLLDLAFFLVTGSQGRAMVTWTNLHLSPLQVPSALKNLQLISSTLVLLFPLFFLFRGEGDLFLVEIWAAYLITFAMFLQSYQTPLNASRLEAPLGVAFLHLPLPLASEVKRSSRVAPREAMCASYCRALTTVITSSE